MENFINDLNKLFQADFGSVSSNGSIQYTDEATRMIGLCNDYLIDDDGTCNWRNIETLRQHGYRVYAGEKDSFGWLTGCVEKDGRILVFG